MPRLSRIEDAGAIYHLPTRGDRREAIFFDETELGSRTKTDPGQMALAVRLRKETTLTIAEIAQRLQMGSRKSIGPKIHQWKKAHE
jgi:hypothetical protein